MFRKTILATSAAILIATPALADSIEGKWRTASGETAAIDKCGGAYCIVLKTGKHAGKRIGRVTGSNGTYKGKITDPADDKTYSGSAKVKGASMSMTGCALVIFCKTQQWARK